MAQSGTGRPHEQRTLRVVEVDDPKLLTAEEIDRALEVAQNWGGWSFEEAELMARALLQTGANPIVRVRAEQNQDSSPKEGA